MKRYLDKIVIKDELKHESHTFDGETYEYDYIEVELYDKDDNLLEVWKWQTEGDLPTEEEFLERTGIKKDVSSWLNID